MTDILKDLTKFLDDIGVWFAAAMMIPVFWTWYEVTLGKRKKAKKDFEGSLSSRGTLPVILIADFLPDQRSIKTDVRRFCLNDEKLKHVDEKHIFELRPGLREIAPNNMPKIVEEIRIVSALISRTGTDVIHLFYGGPIVVATLLGKEFANSHKVLLYQQDRSTKLYENYGPLAHRNFSE